MDYDVLLVSKYPLIREGQRVGLIEGGLQSDKIVEADGKDKALQTLEDVISNGGTIRVVVTDLLFDGKDAGIQLLKAVKARYPSLPVIVTFGEDPPMGPVPIEQDAPEYVAPEVLGKGAFDYHHKSWPILDLVTKVNAALGRKT